MKKAILTACLLMGLGLLLAAVAFFASGCNFGGWFGGDLETVTHEPTADFDRISVKGDTADIILLPSEDGSCRVVTRDKEKEKYQVTVQDGTLCITHDESELSWYDYISVGSSASSITVYLPKTEYASFSLGISTGDVALPAGFTFGEVTLEGSTGDYDIAAAVAGMLSIKISTGDVTVHDSSVGALGIRTSTGDIELSSVGCSGAVTLTQSTGRLTVSDLTAASFSSEANTGDGVMTGLTVSGDLRFERSTGDLVLTDCKALSLTSESSSGDVTARGLLVGAAISITTDTGEVELDASDAAEVYITTDTGDVEASFLSPKIFFYDTDTGDVEIKKSTTGGKCEVVTDSGDISLDFVG